MKKYVSERQLQAGTLLKDGDYESIRQMLGRIREYAPDRQVLAELDGNKNIVYYTSKDLYEEVMNLGDGLLDLGLGGAHIAIISENCCRYVIADICISSGVGVVTPIDANAPAALMGTLLGKCDATAAFCSSDCLGLLKEAKEFCPALRNLTLDLDAPAKILFTSGTTGANKGVVLSNANLAANMMNCLDSIMVAGENTSMSVLPMHHATEINTHIMARIGCARLTYVNDNMRNMMANIKIFKPDVITVVPMIANAFYRNIWAGAKKAGKDEKLRKGIKLCNFLRKFGVDKTHELFPDVFAPFGGNLNMIVCGGSMLNPVVIKGMNDLGIHIENGYGITECGPLISINGDTLSEHLSVGRPCPGLEAKLVNVDSDGIGELCIRGKSVSQGYYKDPEATAAVFDKDGFFNTGDSAKIDSKGRILLMGRKKNTIVLSNGKNICPEEVENIIETNLDYAEDIVVYQASFKGREVLCAGLYISDEARRADRKALAADIAKVNAVLPSYKRIEYVELPASAYEKTSTRKIKRTQLPAECSGEGLIIS